MCTILFAVQAHPDYPLILIANRDEFYERPTRSLHWWEDDPKLLAGKDLQAGGTWMGAHQDGRWAALTNYRKLPDTGTYKGSRGFLVRDFLQRDQPTDQYLSELEASAPVTSGYNLIYGTASETHYFSNRGASPQKLKPGIYGVSNAFLDTPWPKVEKGKAFLKNAIANDSFRDFEQIVQFMTDTTQAPDEYLPDTGIGLEWERQLSALFIKTEKYGTHSTSLMLIDSNGGYTVQERNFRYDRDFQASFTPQKS